MEKAINIANYMLSKKSLTPKQVQKLLYYAYSLYLIKYNENYNPEHMNRLFEDKIEAWKHGPVIRSVYDSIKGIAYSYELICFNSVVKLIDTKTENFIDKILAVFGGYSGYELEKMTHSELPWQLTYIDCDGEARCNRVIDDALIYNFYSRKYKSNV